MIPTFNACIVCEFVREELNSKLIILGYYGVCPNVEVKLGALDRPVALTFVITGGPGNGPLTVSFEILDAIEERVIASSGELQAVTKPDVPTTLVPTLLAVFGHPGTFIIRCVAAEDEVFRAPFRVSQGNF